MDQIDERNMKTVILILTHKCNLNCTYCYEHNKDVHQLDLEQAKALIEKELTMDDGLDREIEFFGGEPLLEFNKIKELYEFIESKDWPKKWLCLMTTNGVLAHGEIKDWIQEHEDTVKVALSADGTAAMHNINRSNSYDLIDFDLFAHGNSVVKMTISAKTLPNLAEGVIHLHKRGFQFVRANLAFGIDWSNEANCEVFASQLRQLADYYLNHPNIRPSDLLDLPIEDINPNTAKYSSRYCGAGVELVAYETDGTPYPCHTFAPVSVGNEIARKSLELNFEKEIPIDAFDEKCQNCLVANVCPNCYGINFSTNGDMYKKNEDYCKMIKIQFLANAYFKMNQYLHGQLKLSPEEEYRLLNNIQLIQGLEV